MKAISTRTWLTSALLLLALGLAADYFFLHYLFAIQSAESSAEIVNFQDPQSVTATPSSSETMAQENASSAIKKDSEPSPAPTEVNNFRESLERCAPEISAQGIGTPEALLEYLTKTIGTKRHDNVVENYHLTLPDGSERRVQVVVDDNTNSTTKKELRFFKLDQEGYPERLNLRKTDTLQSLLALGQVKRQEIKSEIELKDGTSITFETHNNKVYEFQFNNLGKMLSCRNSSCHCP